MGPVRSPPTPAAVKQQAVLKHCQNSLRIEEQPYPTPSGEVAEQSFVAALFAFAEAAKQFHMCRVVAP